MQYLTDWSRTLTFFPLHCCQKNANSQYNNSHRCEWIKITPVFFVRVAINLFFGVAHNFSNQFLGAVRRGWKSLVWSTEGQVRKGRCPEGKSKGCCQQTITTHWTKTTPLIRAQALNSQSLLPSSPCYFFFFKGFYLFIFRQRGGEGEREEEKHWWVASHTCPDRGWNLQPRYVPWPGITPTTFWCMGQHSSQQSHTDKGRWYFLNVHVILISDSCLTHVFCL